LVDLRNLDQIQEQEDSTSAGRLGGWVLGGAGVGALLLTVALSTDRHTTAAPSSKDPLAELVAKAREEAPPADRVTRDNVTFSRILSDREAPTTALVAVKDKDGQLSPPPLSTYQAAPPPTDRLPIVPLPAGNLLETTRFSAKPPDGLSELAADRAQLPTNGERAQAGTDGQYQIQIASFRSADEADKYVEELRLRGHRAYRQAASVPNRGVWQRVRVGPFKNKADAINYKAEFERKEGMATFLVDPEKVERRLAAAKLAAQGGR
jgi:cell division septation protein DedD